MGIFKIFLVGAAIVGLMVTAQNQRWPQRVGFVGVCVATGAPSSSSGGYWYVCKQGIINGFPNLEGDHCDSIGLVSHREVWQCDRQLVSLPGA